MKRLYFLIFISALFFLSCKKEELPEPVSSPTAQVETYNTIKSIIETNCLGCHSSSQNSYINDFSTYNNLKVYLDQPGNSFTARLNSDDESYRMPPLGNLSQSDKSKLVSWINDGYLE